jgi:hypothetical protein
VNRVVNQTLQSVQYLQLWIPCRTLSVKSSLPNETKAGAVDSIQDDPWEAWNRIKNLSESNKRLGAGKLFFAVFGPKFGSIKKLMDLPFNSIGVNKSITK